MHRIHAIVDDQKRRHEDHHRKVKRISLLIFVICTLLIAAGIWYTQLYLSELSDIVTNVASNRFEKPED